MVRGNEKCWGINKKCPVVHLPESKRACPAYTKGGRCWEVNCVDFIDSLEDGDQKKFWRQYILQGCYECPVYFYHEGEIKPRVEMLFGEE